MPSRPPTALDHALKLARVDFAPAHPQPTNRSVVVATVLSIAGSLLADAIVVAIGTKLFPSTRGYVHFRFGDYAKLTVVGVIIACAGWPVVTRITSAPRWLFSRLAVLVTLVLFLPDFYLLVRGDSAKAVAVLMLMHVAIALVTYNCLVHVAKARVTKQRRPGRVMRAPVRAGAPGEVPPGTGLGTSLALQHRPTGPVAAKAPDN